MKESWDYERFIEIYNKIAKEKGGQEFRENIFKERIEKSYIQSSGTSIDEFVESFFQYRQQSDYTKKKEERKYQKNGNIGLI